MSTLDFMYWKAYGVWVHFHKQEVTKVVSLCKMGDENIFIANSTKGDNFCEEVTKVVSLCKMGDENIFIANSTKGDNFCEEVTKVVSLCKMGNENILIACFTKGDNFCDFLFLSLDDGAPSKT